MTAGQSLVGREAGRQTLSEKALILSSTAQTSGTTFFPSASITYGQEHVISGRMHVIKQPGMHWQCKLAHKRHICLHLTIITRS